MARETTASSVGTGASSRWDSVVLSSAGSGGSGATKQQLKKLCCTQGVRTRTPISHKIMWDGSRSTYETYEELIASQIIQNGAGCLLKKYFLTAYKKDPNCVHSDEFWETYHVSARQAIYDIEWLCGVLKSSNRKQTDRHTEANSKSKDGVLTWISFIESFSRTAPSVKQHKIDKLLDVAALPCTKLGTEGIIDWLDTWETK